MSRIIKRSLSILVALVILTATVGSNITVTFAATQEVTKTDKDIAQAFVKYLTTGKTKYVSKYTYVNKGKTLEQELASTYKFDFHEYGTGYSSKILNVTCKKETRSILSINFDYLAVSFLWVLSDSNEMRIYEITTGYFYYTEYGIDYINLTTKDDYTAQRIAIKSLNNSTLEKIKAYTISKYGKKTAKYLLAGDYTDYYINRAPWGLPGNKYGALAGDVANEFYNSTQKDFDKHRIDWELTQDTQGRAIEGVYSIIFNGAVCLTKGEVEKAFESTNYTYNSNYNYLLIKFNWLGRVTNNSTSIIKYSEIIPDMSISTTEDNVEVKAGEVWMDLPGLIHDNLESTYSNQEIKTGELAMVQGEQSIMLAYDPAKVCYIKVNRGAKDGIKYPLN